MELRFSEDEQQFRARARAFVDAHWPSSVRQRTGTASIYHLERSAAEQAWFDALCDAGWSVPGWPVEFGGTDWTATERYIWDRETAVAGTPKMDIFGVTMLGPILCRWGTPAQQARFLPEIRAARMRWCQGYSEPGAGSDLASLATRAVLDGGHFVVDGAKTWTSGGHIADWMFALVRTNPDAERPQAGISFLLIDMTSPGIEVRPIETLGRQHTVNSVVFDRVKVPADQVVGEVNEGWTYAKALLGHERTSVARVAQSQVQLNTLKEIARELDAGLSQDPDFGRKVAELEVELVGLEALELRILADVSRGATPGPEASILKIRGTEIGQRIGELQVEMFGYHALPFADPLLDHNEGAVGHDFAATAMGGYLFGRSWSIYGGANEIQKNIIAKSVLGLGG